MGIDGRQMHIDQANFVFEVNEIDKNKYKFVSGNILDLNFQEFGTFDVVFCHGLFSHGSKHMQILEKIAQVNSDIRLIETRVSRIPGSYMVIQYESTDINVKALDYSFSCHAPTAVSTQSSGGRLLARASQSLPVFQKNGSF